jgi:glycosyltransferase involved in cell wall biosynthesis
LDNVMNLLYVITKSEIGGAQANVYDLINGFATDCNVHLTTGSEGPLTKIVRELNVPVSILPSLTRSINLTRDLQAIRELGTLIKEISPDIIHAHSSKSGIVGRVAGSITRTPVIFTAHGWAFSPGTPLLRQRIGLLSERLTAPLASRLICVCESDRQLALQAGVGYPNTLTTVRYGIRADLQLLANPAYHPPHMIMVARFNEQKDQATLLKAFAQLNVPNVRLDLVGSGPSLDRCKQLAYTLGISENVSFLGDRTDVPELLAKAQIFILSTHYEGLPISILEAMRAGLPVIATDVNGIPEEVIHGETGLLVTSGSVESLASALNAVITSPQLRQRMGMAGRQRFFQHFTSERMLNETKAVYQNVLTSRKVNH